MSVGPRLVLGVALRPVAARRVGVQLGRDDVNAHLQPRPAHLGRHRMPGLVQPTHDGGRAPARRLLGVDFAKALAALLAPVGHARAAAVAQRLAHVLLEHAFPMRALRVGLGLLGRTLGRQLLAHEHPREHATHQGKVRTARVRRVGVLAIDADVPTVFGPVAARVHLQPELRGDGVRRQGGGAVLGHDNHVARVIRLQMHRVFGGRHGRWLLVFFVLFKPSPIAAIARGRHLRPRGTLVWWFDEPLDLGTVRAQEGLASVGVGTRKVDDGTGKQEFVGLGDGFKA